MRRLSRHPNSTGLVNHDRREFPPLKKIKRAESFEIRYSLLDAQPKAPGRPVGYILESRYRNRRKPTRRCGPYARLKLAGNGANRTGLPVCGRDQIPCCLKRINKAVFPSITSSHAIYRTPVPVISIAGNSLFFQSPGRQPTNKLLLRRQIKYDNRYTTQNKRGA
jgi:hypothetical protein